MRPVVGGKSPVIALKSVVLPAPLAPRIPRRSPASTTRSMPAMAFSAPKLRLTPSRTRAWAMAAARRALLALGVGAADGAQRQEFGLRHAQRLGDRRDHLHHLVVEI